jgi:hypothetical protein
LVTLNAAGTGTCTIGNSALGAGGPYAVGATYGGDTDFLGSTGTTGGLTVINSTYTVTYNYDGGTGGPGSAIYTVGGSSLTLPTPTEFGYTFSGLLLRRRFAAHRCLQLLCDAAVHFHLVGRGVERIHVDDISTNVRCRAGLRRAVDARGAASQK